MADGARSAATLQQVADAVNVHRSTASRALNPQTRHLVAPALAARITEAARALGYHPDAAAAGLRTGKSRLIGVIVPDLANPLFGAILAGIEAALTERGYSAIVANAAGGAERCVESLMARRVDGLVLASAALDDQAVSLCLARGFPAVLVNRAERRQRLSAVVPDDRAGMALAVGHLAGLGHCRIGHLAGPPNVSTGLLRAEGFADAAREHRLEAAPIMIAGGYTRDAGEAAAARLLDAHRVTAIVAANDLLALGVYRSAAARGLDVPNDLSVTGHNDMPLVDMAAPPLTTVRIDHGAMGREAAQAILARIDGTAGAPDAMMTHPELIIRASTRAPG